MSEEMKKILDAVLASDFAKKERKERDVKGEIECYGVPQRTMDFESENIYNYFEEDMESVVKIEEVWKWIQEKVKNALDDLWLDRKSFLSSLNNKGYITSQETIFDIVESLRKKLIALYEKSMNEAWASMPLERAKKTLPTGSYVAFLDKDGKLTTEPHMVSLNLNAKVSFEIREETLKRMWLGQRLGKGKVREIFITTDPPKKTQTGECKTVAHRLKDHEVKAEAFSIP